MTGKPLHPDPEKERPGSRANFFKGFGGCVIHLLHVLSLDSAPVVRLEDVERERIILPRRHADAVPVVFHKEEHGKFLLTGETERFKKISLACRSIADRRDHEIFFAVELNAPSHAARRK